MRRWLVRVQNLGNGKLRYTLGNGESKNYEISYSQKQQVITNKYLKILTYLLYFLVVSLSAIIVLLSLIVTNTGLVGSTVRAAFC